MVKVPISLMEDVTKILDKLTDTETKDIPWCNINKAKKLSSLIKDNYTKIKAPHDSSD